MIKKFKSLIKKHGKFKVISICAALSIVLTVGVVVGALDFVGSTGGNTGDYGGADNNYNIPTVTANNVPVGYRFSLLKGGKNDKDMTITILDTEKIGYTGWDVDNISYILTNPENDSEGEHFPLSKMEMAARYSTLHFKVTTRDSGDKRKSRNIYRDDSSYDVIKKNWNDNKRFPLPNIAAGDDNIANTIKNWLTDTRANKILSLFGSLKVKNLEKGDAIFIEPLWAYTYGGKQVVATTCDTALLWGGNFGFNTPYINNTGESGRANLARTFGLRFPQRILITNNNRFNTFVSQYKKATGRSSFFFSGSKAPTWSRANGTNNITPHQTITGGYGACLAYKGNQNSEKNITITVTKKYKISFQYTSRPVSTDAAYGVDGDTLIKKGLGPSVNNQNGFKVYEDGFNGGLGIYKSYNNPVTSDYYKYEEYEQTLDSKGNILSEKLISSSTPQDGDDLYNFRSLLVPANYTRPADDYQWTGYKKCAAVNNDWSSYNLLSLNESTPYDFDTLLSAFGYTLSDASNDNGKSGVTICLYNRVTLAKAYVGYRVLHESNYIGTLSDNLFHTNISNPSWDYQNYSYGDGNQNVFVIRKGSTNGKLETVFSQYWTNSLIDTSSWNDCFKLPYKSYKSGAEAYKSPYKDVNINEWTDYYADGFLSALGDTSDLESLKNGNDIWTYADVNFEDNIGKVALKYSGNEDLKPELKDGYAYNENNVVCKADSNGNATGEVIHVASGKKDEQFEIPALADYVDSTGNYSYLYEVVEGNSYSVEEILNNSGYSLRESDNVTGYLEFGPPQLTKDTKVVINYNIGGVLDSGTNTMEYIKPSDIVSSDNGYLVDENGYICDENKDRITNTIDANSEDASFKSHKDFKLNSYKYKKNILSENQYYSNYLKKGNVYEKLNYSTFEDFFNNNAVYATKLSGDTYQVTVYLRWGELKNDSLIYNIQLYELNGNTYVPVDGNENGCNIIKNGGNIEEDKKYGIKVSVKERDSSLFTVSSSVKYNLNVDIGKYSDIAKTSYNKINISGVFTKNEMQATYFIVPGTDDVVKDNKYTYNLNDFGTGAAVYFLNSTVDTDNIIVSSDLILNNSSGVQNGSKSYEKNAVYNANRYYVSAKISYDNANFEDHVTENNEATMFFFLNPNKGEISVAFKTLNDINDELNSANEFINESKSSIATAYSGQTVREVAVFNPNTSLSPFYNFLENSTILNISPNKEPYVLRDRSFLVRNTDKNSFKISSYNSDINYMAKGTYYQTNTKNNASFKDIVYGSNQSDTAGIGVLYYNLNSDYSTFKNTVDFNATRYGSEVSVYPIDLIAAGSNDSLNSSELETLKPVVELYGLKNGSITETPISNNLSEDGKKKDISEYDSFKIKVRFDIRTSIDFFNNDGNGFDTNIPVNISFAAFSEREGEVFAFSDDNFEFSSYGCKEGNYDNINAACESHSTSSSRSSKDSNNNNQFVYSLTFTSHPFEIDVYRNNSITYKSSFSLTGIDAKYKTEDDGSDSPFDETPIYTSSGYNTNDSIVNEYINGTKKYSDYVKSFEYNSDNNEGYGSVKFKAGALEVSSIGKNVYKRGTSVVTSFKVNNYSEQDFFKGGNVDNTILVTGKVLRDGGSEAIISKDISLVVPRATDLDGEIEPTSTTCWFKWYVDEEYAPGNYEFVLSRKDDEKTIKIGVINFTITEFDKYNTPDTTFTKSKLDGFNKDSVFDISLVSSGNSADRTLSSGESVTWEAYRYVSSNPENHYYKNKYELTLTVIKNSIYNEWGNTINKTSSGYGITSLFKIVPKLTITTYNGEDIVETRTTYSDTSESSFVSTQNVIALFPEFNYQTMNSETFDNYISDNISSDIWKGKSGWNQYSKDDSINEAKYGSYATLKRGEDGSYSMPINTSTLTQTHFLPIWYPDGDYSITCVADEIWTPVGMIAVADESNSIKVEGTMMDDWHFSGYTYIPEEDEINQIRREYELWKTIYGED